MRKLALIMLTVCVVVLSGCNTINGFGRDLEAAGTAIQRNSK